MINGKRAAEKVATSCVTCRVQRAATRPQRMAAVQMEAVMPAPPFTHLSVDICGPFTIRDSVKKRTTGKVWVLVIICKGTKACSMVLLSDLTAGVCAQAFAIHTSRHGMPATISSDGGTQLVACREAFLRTFPDLAWQISWTRPAKQRET